MWTLTLRTPGGKPHKYEVRPGENIIGRNPDNDLIIEDNSASRNHAEVFYDPDGEILSIRDLNSTNGTYLNLEKIHDVRDLKHNDIIRIGGSLIQVTNKSVTEEPKPSSLMTSYLSRDVVLESVDQHAVLIYDVARKLNTVFDLDDALHEVSMMMKDAMGADKCEVILAEQFDKLSELGFPTSIAYLAIDEKAVVAVPDFATWNGKAGMSGVLLGIRSALCVPVISGEEVIGLIYMYKTSAKSQPFDKRDTKLAVAISHQAALTIQRMLLLERVREEQRMRELLQGFLPPSEAEETLQDYLATGFLTGLSEQKGTILFADIADSTGMAERLKPTRFGHILNQYYQLMTDIVFEQGGLVDKFLGDGVLAVFGISGNLPEPEWRAVQAGMKMIEAVKALSVKLGEKIVIGVGINTGVVVAGYIGTRQRVEFTVLGDTVNVAAVLQRNARPNRILVGPKTIAYIQGRASTYRLGSLMVKGRKKTVYAYEVLLHRPDHD
jgi:adenylate cyclase